MYIHLRTFIASLLYFLQKKKEIIAVFFRFNKNFLEKVFIKDLFIYFLLAYTTLKRDLMLQT